MICIRKQIHTEEDLWLGNMLLIRLLLLGYVAGFTEVARTRYANGCVFKAIFL